MSSLVSSAGLHSPNAAAARSAGDRRLDLMATAIVIAVTLAFAGAMFAAIGLTLLFLEKQNYWMMSVVAVGVAIVSKEPREWYARLRALIAPIRLRDIARDVAGIRCSSPSPCCARRSWRFWPR